MTPQKLVEELDKTVSLPGIANVWVPPVRNRLDMLATGIKSPVGIKVNGNNIADIERVARQIEQVVKDVPGVSSALAERLEGGRYVDIRIDRQKPRATAFPSMNCKARSPRWSGAITLAR